MRGDAILSLDKVIELEPENPEAWYVKAKILRDLGRDTEQEECLAHAVSLDPKVEDSVFDGKIKEAEKDDVFKLSKEGILLIEQLKFVEAIDRFGKAIELNPKIDHLWFHKGLAHALCDEPKEAIRCYDKAIELNPKYTKALNNKGDLLNSIGRHNIEMTQEAIECLTKSTRLDPNNDTTWELLGTAWYSAGDVNNAVKCYDNALRLNPENYSVWNNKGLLWESEGRYEEAMRCYDKAIDLNPKYWGAILNKAELLRILKKDDEAKKYFQLGEKLRDNKTDYDTTDTRLFRRDDTYVD